MIVLFGLISLIFFICRILPGDPARLTLGPMATEEQVQALREKLGLNQPVYIQYIRYVQDLFQGDLGMSLLTNHKVTEDITCRLPASLELITSSLVIAIIIGVPLGVISAVNRDKWQDFLSRIGALLGISFPRFWVGIMLQIAVVFFITKYFDWPIYGRAVSPPSNITGFYIIDSILTLNLQAFISSLKHLVLPGFTLALPSIAQLCRITRASMVEQMRRDYTLQAHALGVHKMIVVYKYMLKNAFTSSLTLIGMTYAAFLGMAFAVETVFSWPGIASYGVNAILFRDFNAVMAVVIIVGLMFVLVNLIVDILYGYLDPRIRYERR